jgi:protein-disulfide isomerase/uncharacterized membrane protein
LSLILDGALAVFGLSLSAYALHHHLLFKATGMTQAFCNVNATVSCDAIAASPYSEIAGIPLGVFGISFFASLLLLNVIRAAANRGGHIGRMASQGHAVLVVTGVAVSVVLGSIALFAVKAVCLVCIGIYVVCIGLAVSLFYSRFQLARPFRKSSVVGAGLIAVSVTGLSAYSFTTLSRESSNRPGSSTSGVAASIEASGLLNRGVLDIPLSRSPYSGAGEDYRYGNEQAKVIVHEFVDFQCPACAAVAKTLRDLKDRYGSRVLFVFRNYPLDSACNQNIRGRFHDHSCAIAAMARCAGQYGKFWEYANLAFERQQQASAENVVRWAEQIGLKQEAIAVCQKSEDLINKLKDDVSVADRIGVNGTPTLFINGIRYDGDRSIDSLSQAIESALIAVQ